MSEQHNAVLYYLKEQDNYRAVEKIHNALKDKYPNGLNLVLDSINGVGVLSHRTESNRHEYLLKQYERDAMNVLPREFDGNPYGYFKDEYDKEQANERSHKWYLRADAKQRFDDYPTIKKHKRNLIILAVTELILLVLSIL